MSKYSEHGSPSRDTHRSVVSWQSAITLYMTDMRGGVRVWLEILVFLGCALGPEVRTLLPESVCMAPSVSGSSNGSC